MADYPDLSNYQGEVDPGAFRASLDASGIPTAQPTSPSSSSSSPSPSTGTTQPSSILGGDYAYQTPSGEQVKSDGTAHLQTGNGTIDEPIYQGTSYGTLNDLENATGKKGAYNPDTGQVTIDGVTITPVGFNAKNEPMVGLRNAFQSLGYDVNWNGDNNTISVNKSKNLPAAQQQSQQSNGQLMNLNFGQPQQVDPNASMNSWANFWNSQQPAQPQQFPIQQQFTPDWQSYYNQAHAQIDPLYQTKLNDLMTKQSNDITAMNESMNRRGIFTSGIAQAAENDLRAKTTNAVASLFNKQMSDIEKTSQTLYNQAYKAFTDGNNFALKYNQDQLTNYLNQQKMIFNQWLGTQKLNQQQQQYALDSWNKMATLLLNEQKTQLPYQQQTANNMANNQTAMYKFQNLSADQLATHSGFYMGADGQLHPTLQNTNDQQQNALKYAQMMGVDDRGRPTLEAMKNAGLTPIGVDENGNVKFVQTAAASDADRKYALDLAKARGGWVDENGNIVVPTEQALHDRQTEQNASDSLKLRMDQIMGYVNGQPTLDRQKLTDAIQKGQQTIAIAQQNARTNEDKATLQKYSTELSGINADITSIMNRHLDGKIAPNSEDYKNLDTLTTRRNSILDQLNAFQGTNINFPEASH